MVCVVQISNTEIKMSERKCFLNNCNATVGDCKKTKCKCLICLGKNKNNCELLHDEHKAKLQQVICSMCKNCNNR